MSVRVLIFMHAEQKLAIAAELGREAFVPQHLLPLPGGTGSLLGLTEVRGRTVPLLNLSALLGQQEVSRLPALALLIESSGELLALPVTSVLGVFSADAVPVSANVLSETFSCGEHLSQLLNPVALLVAAQTRLALT